MYLRGFKERPYGGWKKVWIFERNVRNLVLGSCIEVWFVPRTVLGGVLGT
jgi:hypothetical protein